MLKDIEVKNFVNIWNMPDKLQINDRKPKYGVVVLENLR